MAEFCFECYNKLNNGKCKKENYILSDDLELCEGCGKYKKIVICYQKGWLYNSISFCFDIISFPFYLLRIFIIKIYFLFKK